MPENSAPTAPKCLFRGRFWLPFEQIGGVVRGAQASLRMTYLGVSHSLLASLR